MKNFLLFTFIITAHQLFSQSGIGTFSPHKQTQLHIEATNRGILIPRINLSSLEDKAAIIDDSGIIVESLLVYNNKETGIPKGYYYWSHNKWNRIIIQQDIDNIKEIQVWKDEVGSIAASNSSQNISRTGG